MLDMNIEKLHLFWDGVFEYISFDEREPILKQFTRQLVQVLLKKVLAEER